MHSPRLGDDENVAQNVPAGTIEKNPDPDDKSPGAETEQTEEMDQDNDDEQISQGNDAEQTEQDNDDEQTGQDNDDEENVSAGSNDQEKSNPEKKRQKSGDDHEKMKSRKRRKGHDEDKENEPSDDPSDAPSDEDESQDEDVEDDKDEEESANDGNDKRKVERETKQKKSIRDALDKLSFGKLTLRQPEEPSNPLEPPYTTRPKDVKFIDGFRHFDKKKPDDQKMKRLYDKYMAAKPVQENRHPYPASYPIVNRKDYCTNYAMHSLKISSYLHPEAMDAVVSYLEDDPAQKIMEAKKRTVRISSAMFLGCKPIRVGFLGASLNRLPSEVENMTNIYNFEEVNYYWKAVLNTDDKENTGNEIQDPLEYGQLLIPYHYEINGKACWALFQVMPSSRTIEVLDLYRTMDFSLPTMFLLRWLLDCHKWANRGKQDSGSDDSGSDDMSDDDSVSNPLTWDLYQGRLCSGKLNPKPDNSIQNSGIWTIYLMMLCDSYQDYTDKNQYQLQFLTNIRMTLWFELMNEGMSYTVHVPPTISIRTGDLTLDAEDSDDWMYLSKFYLEVLSPPGDEKWHTRLLVTFFHLLEILCRKIGAPIVFLHRSKKDLPEAAFRNRPTVQTFAFAYQTCDDSDESKKHFPTHTLISVTRKRILNNKWSLHATVYLGCEPELISQKEKNDIITEILQNAHETGWLEEEKCKEALKDLSRFVRSDLLPKNRNARKELFVLQANSLQSLPVKESDVRQLASVPKTMIESTALLLSMIDFPTVPLDTPPMSDNVMKTRRTACDLFYLVMKCCQDCITFSTLEEHVFFYKQTGQKARPFRTREPPQGGVLSALVDMRSMLYFGMGDARDRTIEDWISVNSRNLVKDSFLQRAGSELLSHKKFRITETSEFNILEWTEKYLSLCDTYEERLKVVTKAESVSVQESFAGVNLTNKEKKELSRFKEFSEIVHQAPMLEVSILLTRAKEMVKKYTPTSVSHTARDLHDYWGEMHNKSKEKGDNSYKSRAMRILAKDLQSLVGTATLEDARGNMDTILEKIFELRRYHFFENLPDKLEYEEMMELDTLFSKGKEKCKDKKVFQKIFQLLKKLHGLYVGKRLPFRHPHLSTSNETQKEQGLKKLRIFLKAFIAQLKENIKSREDDRETKGLSFSNQLKDSKEFLKMFNKSGKKMAAGTSHFRRQEKVIRGPFEKLKETDPTKNDDPLAAESLRFASVEERAYVAKNDEKVRQASHLNYNWLKREWRCTMTTLKGKNEKETSKQEVVSENWVKDNFQPEFLVMVKEINKRDTDFFVTIPLGKRDRQTARKHCLQQEICKQEVTSLFPIMNFMRVKSVKMTYWSDKDAYCLGYGLASAVAYIGEKEAAETIALKAKDWSLLPRTEALKDVMMLMEREVPSFGRHQVICDAIEASRKRKFRAEERVLSIKKLTKQVDDFLKIVIPFEKDGGLGHSFCVVRNLIFDASQPTALKLSYKTLNAVSSGIHRIAYAATFNAPSRAFHVYQPKFDKDQSK